MKFLAGLPIWLLLSCARCEVNMMDKLDMADMDSTLGLFEKNFGESLTKKLSSALFQGTQKMRPPMEILLSFMKGLTSDEIESMTQGIVSSVQELAELLKQPEAQEQLTFFINTAPTILAALSGSGVSDNKFVPPGNDRDSGPIESKVNDKETAEDFKGGKIMEMAESLIKSGASLMGSSLGLDGDLTEPGGGLEQFASKLLERMFKEGLLDEDMNYDLDYDPIGDEATPFQLGGEKPNGESKSDKVHKENENEKHSEL